MPSVRLDQLLVGRGLARSRAEAQALLLAGRVEMSGGGSRILKPGQMVDPGVAVAVVAGPRWASRGGEKLEAALDAFEIAVAGRACLDSGASTGGFTDVLLARGARIVYAVDVGRGQLIDRLRRDPRVVNMERTNLRSLEALPEPVQLATLDLSFIGLRQVLPAVRRLLTDDGQVVALIKPQFEAGRGMVPRGGVIRDPAVHREVLLRFGVDLPGAGFRPIGLIRSPISGSDGNVEFLAHLAAGPAFGPTAGLAASAERRMDESRWIEAVDALTPVARSTPRITMRRVKRRGERSARVEQLSVFEGLEAGALAPMPAPDTMRQIVSLRMPDALIERLEAAAHSRGVSPSSLMRAFIAAGLDRSYAAVTEFELAGELAALRRRVDEIADRLAMESVTPGRMTPGELAPGAETAGGA